MHRVCCKYEVSSIGRVRDSQTGYIFMPSNHRQGYLMVRLLKENGRYWERKTLFIHRLVMYAFKPLDSFEKMLKLTVNHKDGNKRNNLPSNLEWVTLRENISHSVRTGLSKKNRLCGEDNVLNKYPESLVRKVCEMIVQGHKRKHISEALEVPLHFVKNIKYKKNWVVVSNEYF